MPRYINITPRPLMDQAHGASVVLVGAGGIGARILPTLVKLLPQNGLWRVYVLDHDKVEARNCIRQPYIPEDVGRNKAEVMAERYTTEDLPVIAIPEKYNEETLPGLSTSIGRMNHNIAFLLGAVDAGKPRKFMLETADTPRYTGPVLAGYVHYIDAGNDGDRGQVLIAHSQLRGELMADDGRTQNMWGAIHGAKKFPNVFEPGPDEDKPQTCDPVDTQTALTNHVAATWVLQYLAMMLHGKSIGTCGVSFYAYGGSTLFPVKSERSTFRDDAASIAHLMPVAPPPVILTTPDVLVPASEPVTPMTPLTPNADGGNEF